MSDFDEWLASEMEADPEFAAEYERLGPEYAAIAALADARAESGMTLAELSDACGMRPESISRIENGRSLPTLRTLQRLAAGMGKRLEVRFV